MPNSLVNHAYKAGTALYEIISYKPFYLAYTIFVIKTGSTKI